MSELTALEKLDLYALGQRPERLEPDAQKLLHANIRRSYGESDAYPIYEGRIGASPREMRVVLLDAAQSTKYACLSPLAVLEEIEQLCQRTQRVRVAAAGSARRRLPRREAIPARRSTARLLDEWEHEFYASSGLVDEDHYAELFERYVQHVSVWVKKERIRNASPASTKSPTRR